MVQQRSIITPDHFVVDKAVLGLPLASPSRRAWAMAIDGLLVLFLVKAGGLLLGIVAAILMFRASAPDPRSGFISRYVRMILRFAGAIIIAVIIFQVWKQLPRGNRADEDAAADSTDFDVHLDVPAGEAIKLAGAMLRLRNADDSVEVAGAARDFLTRAHRSGVKDSELLEQRPELLGVLGDDVDSSEIRAVDAAFADVIGKKASAKTTDTIARQIDSLRHQVRSLRASNSSLENRLQKAQKKRGFRQFLAGAADDMGIGFGWSAVYFTAFWALWRGQTPGKRVAGIRVLRLDGKPLGWWMSFERFGGYAASASVGLLGFLQILWDRNRQGLHDKACETVVVKEP